MSRPTVRIYTSIDSYIDRDMNDAEYAQYQLDVAVAEARKAEEQTRIAQRQALLSRLGITEEEARILLGGN